MAYVERWSAEFTTGGGASTYTISIKENGYGGGSTEIVDMGGEPFVFRNRGNDIFSIGAVIGSEIEFTFWIKPSDGSTYDDLFTAVSRQFLIEVSKGGHI